MKFNDYNLKEYIKKGLKDIGFYETTPIQEKVLERALKKESLIAKSQTGTGKTHAFLLPILESLDETIKEVQSVIIVPTRELGLQINSVITDLIKSSNNFIDVRLYIGGSDRLNEVERLKKSQPQIVIGTIGKLKDLSVKENILKLHTAKCVVIDEADMVFERKEIENIDNVFNKLSKDIQILIFSATISQEINVFINKYLNKIDVIDLTKNSLFKNEIKHIFIPTKNKSKDELLFDLIQTFHPYLALIFANTKQKVDEIASFMSQKGLKVAKLTGDLEPRERKSTLKRIKDGLFQFVVASDIASRGIDIIGVTHVINYELPKDVEFYVHRTGRTARFDMTGLAISFYDFDDEAYMNSLKEKKINGEFMILKNGELISKSTKNFFSNKTKKLTKDEEDVHKKIPLSKKVKPGYKKKRNEEISKEIRKIRRSKIENIYKRKAKHND